MTGQRDDDARCWDCGHPWDTDCGCTCCSGGDPTEVTALYAAGLIIADRIAHGGDDASDGLDDCPHGYIRQTCMTCITGVPYAV